MFQGIEVTSVEKYSHGAYKECLVTVDEIIFHEIIQNSFWSGLKAFGQVRPAFKADFAHAYVINEAEVLNM